MLLSGSKARATYSRTGLVHSTFFFGFCCVGDIVVSPWCEDVSRERLEVMVETPTGTAMGLRRVVLTGTVL